MFSIDLVASNHAFDGSRPTDFADRLQVDMSGKLAFTASPQS